MWWFDVSSLLVSSAQLVIKDEETDQQQEQYGVGVEVLPSTEFSESALHVSAIAMSTKTVKRWR